MFLYRRTLLISAFAATIFLIAAAQADGPDSNRNDMDLSIKPGDDFYRYANGGWLKTVSIPQGQTSYDNRAFLTERSSQRVRDLMRHAASSHPVKGTVEQKIGDYYASFMDEAAIEANGFKPLSRELSSIAAIQGKHFLSAYLGTTLNTESDGLTANADHIFGLWVNQGFEDSAHNFPHILQGGLGMPERDNYLDPSPRMATLRSQYQTHIAAVLKLAGIADPENKAAQILAFETEIAKAFAPDSDAVDVFKQNNPWKRSDFSAKAPGMDWEAYFKAAGFSTQVDFIVWQPLAVIGVSALVDSTSIETWRNYLTFHLIEHYANALPKAVSAEHFAFYGKILTGTQQAPERETLAIEATNGAISQAVGQLYTQHYFSPDAKAAAQAMAANIITAFRTRIAQLSWMSPETKQKAIAKLDAFTLGVGYPDEWIDYSTLDVVRGDTVGNMRRAEAFNRRRNLALLKQPSDPAEWRIDPQVPGAIIMFTPNAEFFSAALLQPPYFDSHGDAASNYGSAGAGMAHEISHSFDELGNIYDARGRLGSWWTAQDLDQYHAAGNKLAAQFDGYCPFSNVCVNGKQVLNEGIADIAGLQVAHDAYILSLKGKPDVVIGGLTGEQRFYLAFAQRWRRVQSDDLLRRQIASDSHPPGEFRSDTVRNIDSWYKAYDVAPGDKLYLAPDKRVAIW